jgi:hypothetical protein
VLSVINGFAPGADDFSWAAGDAETAGFGLGLAAEAGMRATHDSTQVTMTVRMNPEAEGELE